MGYRDLHFNKHSCLATGHMRKLLVEVCFKAIHSMANCHKGADTNLRMVSGSEREILLSLPHNHLYYFCVLFPRISFLTLSSLVILACFLLRCKKKVCLFFKTIGSYIWRAANIVFIFIAYITIPLSLYVYINFHTESEYI